MKTRITLALVALSLVSVAAQAAYINQARTFDASVSIGASGIDQPLTDQINDTTDYNVDDYFFNGGTTTTWTIDNYAKVRMSQNGSGGPNRFFVGESTSDTSTLTFSSSNGTGGWLQARANAYAAMRIGQDGDTHGIVNVNDRIQLDLGWSFGGSTQAQLNINSGQVSLISNNTDRMMNNTTIFLGKTGSATGKYYVATTFASLDAYTSAVSGVSFTTTAGNRVAYAGNVEHVYYDGTSGNGALFVSIPEEAAVVTLANADFRGDLTDWTTGGSGAYSNQTARGTDQFLALKAESSAWAMQAITTAITETGTTISDIVAGDFGEYEVQFDAGYRRDATTNGDISLRVSLWDTTNNVEITGQTIDIVDPGVEASNNFLKGELVTLVYDETAYDAEGIAVRFFNEEVYGTSYTATATVDNVVVSAVPEPATMSLLAMGGLALLRRKRK